MELGVSDLTGLEARPQSGQSPLHVLEARWQPEQRGPTSPTEAVSGARFSATIRTFHRPFLLCCLNRSGDVAEGSSDSPDEMSERAPPSPCGGNLPWPSRPGAWRSGQKSVSRTHVTLYGPRMGAQGYRLSDLCDALKPPGVGPRCTRASTVPVRCAVNPQVS